MRPSLQGLVALCLSLNNISPTTAKDNDDANTDKGNNTVWVTPHDSYSSSVGVLGCKIDTNRVAYWPMSVDCDHICVELTYDDRKVHLLRVDQSGGAHDVSYDAWNYLNTGRSATDKPIAGGAVEMTYRDVDASECAHLIHAKGGKLPLSASNSMNYLVSCLEQEDSWVAKHYALYNIMDPICTQGFDEVCKLEWPDENQAICKHQLGLPHALTDDPVVNIRYPTGEEVVAGQAAEPEGGDEDSAAGVVSIPGPIAWFSIAGVSLVGLGHTWEWFV